MRVCLVELEDHDFVAEIMMEVSAKWIDFVVEKFDAFEHKLSPAMSQEIVDYENDWKRKMFGLQQAKNAWEQGRDCFMAMDRNELGDLNEKIGRIFNMDSVFSFPFPDLPWDELPETKFRDEHMEMVAQLLEATQANNMESTIFFVANRNSLLAPKGESQNQLNANGKRLAATYLHNQVCSLHLVVCLQMHKMR
jgi:hypothetical protein